MTHDSFVSYDRLQNRYGQNRQKSIMPPLLTARPLFYPIQSNPIQSNPPLAQEDEAPIMSLPCAIGMLTVITIIVAFSSNLLTGSIEEVSEQTGLGQAFLGMIVLPIAGRIGLDWIGLDWIGLDWIGLDWIGFTGGGPPALWLLGHVYCLHAVARRSSA
jgi:Ca2+/H+ antiporter